MKIYFTVLLLTLATITNAQQISIVGKWKPTFFSMGGQVTGDLSKDAPEVKMSLDSLVKNDKDPEASKEMMTMFFQLIFDKSKNLTEEYKANGEFVDTNLKNGKIKSGTYTFDDQKNELLKTYNGSPKQNSFKVKQTGDKLTLTTIINTTGEKETELIVTYQKL